MIGSIVRFARWHGRVATALAAVLWLAPGGAAQFNLVPWAADLDGTIGGLSYDADAMGISSDWSTASGSVLAFHSVAPVSGTVSVDIDLFLPLDGSCIVSSPVFLLEGAMTQLATCGTSDAHLEFLVPGGASFGLGLLTKSSGWPSFVTFANFDFEPLVGGATWTNLHNGLPGAAGMPALTITSLLYAHFPFTLDVSGAAPSSTAALVIGFSAIDAPFKGGVLVPNVDLVLAGLHTSPTGALQLATGWPGGVPAGFALYFQAWIVDAGGPAGFAATAALEAVTP